jgi:hypothetical protein
MSMDSPFDNVRIVFCFTTLINSKLVTDGAGTDIGTGTGTGARTGGVTGPGQPTTSKQTVNVVPQTPLPSTKLHGFAEMHWCP